MKKILIINSKLHHFQKSKVKCIVFILRIRQNTLKSSQLLSNFGLLQNYTNFINCQDAQILKKQVIQPLQQSTVLLRQPLRRYLILINISLDYVFIRLT